MGRAGRPVPHFMKNDLKHEVEKLKRQVRVQQNLIRCLFMQLASANKYRAAVLAQGGKKNCH